ncbi:MAG TPA: metalloregulator ArsR/SmtB family transcription factor [Bacilli bacterium]|nr:MAG: HTH-type transcriptional repressor CzrA [Tenericutes bacterium ADurb.BinA124]HNZ50908.1 metalloregulator ArsR/SmtB family transcription factor [Bacilli bacterium]HOH18683.1 metalloregulator ArsR/SmtB family transcription factor [Bacilli bacterium]HPX84459.1 metalloregulator ArsR/SmtB family transcription factor [Bacilli bacterium]HQC75005.1 metalloregulator ArsR/SmtB family transcription factor [Bacilli bacterium]
MDNKQYALVFKALGDENRIQMVLMLSQKELCARQFYEKLGISQAMVSHHLRILREAKIIKGRKAGKGIYYSLNKDMIAEMLLFFDFLDFGNMQCACQEGFS